MSTYFLKALIHNLLQSSAEASDQPPWQLTQRYNRLSLEMSICFTFLQVLHEGAPIGRFPEKN